MAESNATALNQLDRAPLYYEAREYCEVHGLGPEEVEHVRQSMAHREWMKRTQPFRDMLVKVHPAVYGMRVTSEWIKTEKSVREIMKHEAQALGLTVS